MGDSTSRREAVLDTARETFLRFGYRNTSMDDIARAGDISRPGLYFLFTSKRDLFAAAVTRALERDLRAATRALHDPDRPLAERLGEAFDIWTGRYLGAVGGELSAVADEHCALLEPAVSTSSDGFHAPIIDTVVGGRPPEDRATSEAIARTLIATAIGLKHQTTSHDTFRNDLQTSITVLLR